MDTSVSAFLLVAKQREIDELRRLAVKARFVGTLGQMVHALQNERGATSIFLGSGGERFADTREALVRGSVDARASLDLAFADELRSEGGGARLYTLMARAWQGLDALPSLRERVAAQQVAGVEAVEAFTRTIGALVALVFEVADAAVDPEVSRLLVALFNLVQGKELAGQERALGGLCFGAGRCDEAEQDRLAYLIDAQDRCFQLFAQFAEASPADRWAELQDAPFVAQLERLRRALYGARRGVPIDRSLHDKWFEASTARITGLANIEHVLVEQLQSRCRALIEAAERRRQDVEGLLADLRDRPPVALDATTPAGSQPLTQLLQAQSDRLAAMQADLDAARQALNERKLIERAKGVLMERFQIGEDAAHVMMRKASMDQNLRLVDVAQAGLSLPAFLTPAPRTR